VTFTQPEDKALVIGAAAGILGVLGTVLSGDPKYVLFGSAATGFGLVLKGLIPAKPGAP
jgi:hypothetical protein